MSTLGLLDLTFGLSDIGPGYHEFRVELCNLAPRGFHSGFLLRTVQSEERVSLLHWTGVANENLSDATIRLRNDRDSAKEQCDVVRGRMVVKDDRDQRHGQNQASCDPPPQFKPHRVKRYFLAKPFSLNISTKKIVWKNGQQRAEEEFKHGPSPSCLMARSPVLSAA